jgi:hypothetical protein
MVSTGAHFSSSYRFLLTSLSFLDTYYLKYSYKSQDFFLFRSGRRSIADLGEVVIEFLVIILQQNEGFSHTFKEVVQVLKNFAMSDATATFFLSPRTTFLAFFFFMILLSPICCWKPRAFL